jgi:hypothetical protein
MAVPRVDTSETFKAGFDFARRLRDPEFRALLGCHHWDHGMQVVMAVDEEPVVDVISRMIMHEAGPRAFIAIPDSNEEYGYRLLTVEVSPAGQRQPDPIELGPSASIGMLCAALEPCGSYLPSDWTEPLVFERISRRSGGR